MADAAWDDPNVAWDSPTFPWNAGALIARIFTVLKQKLGGLRLRQRGSVTNLK